MKKLSAFMTSLVLIGATAVFAQQTPPPSAADERAKGRTATGEGATRARTATEPDVSYGRVKEFTAGQKIVVDIDNAVDKSFDLTDKDVQVKLARGLKVGDTVKVSEHSVAGKTKSVAITKHSGGNVRHGDKDPAAKP
jgi:hypothetical protein